MSGKGVGVCERRSTPTPTPSCSKSGVESRAHEWEGGVGYEVGKGV